MLARILINGIIPSAKYKDKPLLAEIKEERAQQHFSCVDFFKTFCTKGHYKTYNKAMFYRINSFSFEQATIEKRTSRLSNMKKLY